jgi:hypothetical protein
MNKKKKMWVEGREKGLDGGLEMHNAWERLQMWRPHPLYLRQQMLLTVQRKETIRACPRQHFQSLPGDFLIIPPDFPTTGSEIEEWNCDRFSVQEWLRAGNC